MFSRMDPFRSDTSGAVTVDYVVLAAALIGLGLSVANAVRFGTVDAMEKVVPMISKPVPCKSGSEGGADIGSCG